MRFTSTSRIALVALLGFAACAPPPPTPDASPDANDSGSVQRDSAADVAANDSATVNDTGSTPDSATQMDTGVSPADTGVSNDAATTPDSEMPPADSGVPPLDSGAPPLDSGVPPLDSGVPPLDSGVPPLDSGVPPLDSGVPPGTLLLTNPSADFSQPSYFVNEAVNGVRIGDNDGWAITSGGVNRTAVFETSADTPNYAGGTELAFTLTQASMLGMSYTLGRFRISVTTADRAMFADGVANGGNLGPPTIWSVAQVVSASATGGATLTIQSDNSVLASGSTPATSTYSVRVRTPHTRITGIKIEALTHPSLPSQGPGRANNGNFILTEVSVIASAAPIPATTNSVAFGAIPASTAGSFSQTSFAPSEAVDGMLPAAGVSNGWAIDNGFGACVAQTAVFETATNTPANGGFGTRLVFTLHQLFGTNHTMGRFRLLATTSDRSLFADGMSTGGLLGTSIWTPLSVRAASATTGSATFTVLSDGSVLANTSSASAVYSIAATTPLEGITGVRIEALEDPSLQASGPGNSGSGNFVLTELQLASGPQI